MPDKLYGAILFCLSVVYVHFKTSKQLFTSVVLENAAALLSREAAEIFLCTTKLQNIFCWTYPVSPCLHNNNNWTERETEMQNPSPSQAENKQKTKVPISITAARWDFKAFWRSVEMRIWASVKLVPVRDKTIHIHKVLGLLGPSLKHSFLFYKDYRITC